MEFPKSICDDDWRNGLCRYGIYRVFKKSWRKMIANCYKNMSTSDYWGLTRYGPFDKICLSCFWVPFGGFYRVPNKDINYIDQLDEKLLGALRNGLQIKVGWVLESSGNFLSSEYKNIIIWSRNAWENWCIVPTPQKKGNWTPKYDHLCKYAPFSSSLNWL